MSRHAKLPDALRVERVERRAGTETITPLEGAAWVDVAAARAIYAVSSAVIVEMDGAHLFRFVMADEGAACNGVETLALVAMHGGR